MVDFHAKRGRIGLKENEMYKVRFHISNDESCSACNMKQLYYKVRFHLGKGPYFKHWQISGKDGVEYYNPETEQLTLYNCTLISQSKAAQKVFESGKKDVCGWISCSKIVVEGSYDIDLDKYHRVWYNPIVDTDWHVQGYPNHVTGLTFPELITKGNKVYCYDQG